MAESEKRLWGIHTQDDTLFLKHGTIAIGWREMGDLNDIENNREAFKAKYQLVYPDAKKGSIPTGSGMLYRFCHEVQIGDYIVFPSKSDRMVNIGEVTGDYKYDASQPEYVQTRTVKWLKNVPRTAFTQGALYEIGSAMSFFAVKNYADEFLAALEKGFKHTASSAGEDPTVGATAEDIIESTKDFVLKELSRNLKGYALEEFVANLLQAMGYRTTVSPQGGDMVKLQPIYDAWQKKNFRSAKERYSQEHSDELNQYRKAVRLLLKVNGSKTVDHAALEAESKELAKTINSRTGELESVKDELKQLRSIQYYVSKVLPEEAEPEKVSISDRLSEGRLQSDRAAGSDPEQPERKPNIEH